MLDRAKKDLSVSQKLFNGFSDELDLEISAYHLQQGIEKLMKFEMEVNDIPYPFVHDLRKLFDVASNGGLEMPEWIWEHSSLLNTYESKTRYGDNLVATKREIEGFLVLAQAYAEAVIKRTTTETSQNSVSHYMGK